MSESRMQTRTHRTHGPEIARPSSPTVTSSPSMRAVAPSQGQSLDPGTRREMSARFGHDFASIRIHADAQAQESARALGANAYTLGNDIFFGAGQYSPGSRAGERLLAHELTHAVQQARSGPGDRKRASARSDASEREAETLAEAALAGRTVDVKATPDAAIARDDRDGSPEANQNFMTQPYPPGSVFNNSLWGLNFMNQPYPPGSVFNNSPASGGAPSASTPASAQDIQMQQMRQMRQMQQIQQMQQNITNNNQRTSNKAADQMDAYIRG